MTAAFLLGMVVGALAFALGLGVTMLWLLREPRSRLDAAPLVQLEAPPKRGAVVLELPTKPRTSCRGQP